jgi:Fuc2NAc and GlcNAc transferase
LKTLLIILSLAVCSFILTYIIRLLALKNNIYSIPNERSLHNIPTPFGGGLAITITWYIGITIFYLEGFIEEELFLALMSGSIIAVISFIDDFINIKPLIRLFFHFLTAIIAFLFLNGLRPLIIPGLELNYVYLVYPLVIIGIVWFINLFNFMDGIDGFAATEAITISLIIYFLSGNVINLLLIGCISGFLFWNWPKAKIFMGDIGSTQLGFILIILGIYFHNSFQFSILNWIMLSSPFWFDATFTLLRRWKNGEKLSQAHRKHAYQRIVQFGFSHLKVNMILFIINIFVFIIILIYRQIKVLQIPLFLTTLVLFYIITKQVDKKVPFKKNQN